MNKQKQARLVIRDARPEELDDVAGMMREAYEQYNRAIPTLSWEFYVQDVMNVRGRLDVAELIVAELDGRPAGAVTLYPASAESSQEGWPAGWAGVRLLAVHPSHRGKGIGLALMSECVRRCRDKGFATIGLHTTEFMAVAKKMYERMGFVRVPQYDFHPASGVVVMAYRLDL